METAEEYLAALPEDRRAAIGAIRAVILEHLPAGYVEQIRYGMLTYCVPLERFADTYNGQPLQLVGLASQKRHMALYMMGVYGETDRTFRERWQATGKKLDMGKSCVRFRRLEDVPLEVVGESIAATPVAALIASHERAHAAR
jgi:hypothetical protein